MLHNNFDTHIAILTILMAIYKEHEMRIVNKTLKGNLVKRLNRFEGIVEIEGREELVHI